MIRAAHFLRLVILTSLAAACGSPAETLAPPPPPPPPPPALTGPGPFVVSNALGPVAFISALPDSPPLLGAITVTLEVLRAGAVVSAAVIPPSPGGGLDPVGVPAAAGDTVSARLTGSATPAWVFTIPSRTPPILIRTEPRTNDPDVALNARIRVVFSEPIDPASLTSQNIDLRSGDSSLAGQVGFANPEHTVAEFTPAAILSVATVYQLMLGAGIRDLDGTPIGVATSISFATAPPRLLPMQADLAFVRDGQIYVVATANGGLVQLTNTGAGTSNQEPAWSPDGGRIAFVTYDQKSGSSSLFLMDANGANVVRRAGDFGSPAWSPDGRLLAVTSGDCTYYCDIHLMSAHDDGEAPVHLRSSGAEPAWSPDGTMIAFVSLSGDDGYHALHVMNADGTAVREVTLRDPGGIYGPTWSPDGRRIAFSKCFDSCDIFAVDADAASAPPSALAQLTTSGNAGAPAWSPDGAWIAFTVWPPRQGSPSVAYVPAATGGEPIPLFSGGHTPAWRPSPSR